MGGFPFPEWMEHDRVMDLVHLPVSDNTRKEVSRLSFQNELNYSDFKNVSIDSFSV